VAVDERPGRGVLEGGFHLLDVLSRFEAGAGLSELARHAQLPKATTHRLLEQLLDLGAVARQGHRYVVGPLLGRLGSSWQPDPALATAARDPIRMLSARTATVVGVSVLHRGRVLLAAGTRGVLTEIPQPRPADPIAESTAAARVHQLAAHPSHGEPPPGYTPGAWAAVHRRYGRSDAVVVEHEEVVPNISCAAAAVRDADGTTIAVISATAIRTRLPSGVADLTAHAAHEISRNLARSRGR
jgi:DNA-binding IclR family transcriptional regulator